VVADAQDAMLYAQAGQFETAAELMQKALARADEGRAPAEIVAAIWVQLADIKTRQGKFLDARRLAEDAAHFSSRLPPRVQADITRILEIAKSRAPLTSEFENFIALSAPLEVAGTSDCRDIHSAHQRIVGPLLQWTARWPKTIGPGFYDFWGRGNFSRYILNHRGWPDTSHVTVEVTTIAEARHWARVLCPLVDVLTILWKGPVETAFTAMLPVHIDYSGPGGWGYVIAAGSSMRPDDDPNDWDWAPAMGQATLLPSEATDFLFTEAGALFEAGRLFLLPAPNVGCIDAGHGPMQQIFNDVVNAVPYLSDEGTNARARSLESLPLPYFSDVPLSELARVIVDEEDSLLETRIELRRWARTVASEQVFEEREVGREIRERVESSLRSIERRYADLARRLSWAKNSGEVRSYVLKPETMAVEPKNLAAAELAALHGSLRSSPWYAFFRLSSAGHAWDLTRAPTSRRETVRKSMAPQRIYHWLVPPKPGWTIPTVSVPGSGSSSG
jgi:hypothetical protein